MSGNGQNHQLPDAVEPSEDVQEDEEDEFGEFEGFEGGVERMQAQPAPSPWATFPDLLPVQSSPATPAEDGQGGASTSRGNGASSRDMSQPPMNLANWPSPGVSHEEPRPMPQQMRSLNPPDVSLGTNQAVGGRVTPDNVHDASVAVIMDHMDNGMVQIDRLTQQLENADQVRTRLEDRLNQLRQRNADLEQQIAGQQAQIRDLQARLQHNQESMEHRLSEMNLSSSAEWRHDLRQIQEEISAIRQSQIADRREIEPSVRSIAEMRTGISDRLEVLEVTIRKERLEMENRLTDKMDEQNGQVQRAIESVIQQTAQHLSGNLSQLIGEAVRNSNVGDSQENGLLQSLKDELERHKDQQRKVLEEERQRQLKTLSLALQSALQQINGSMSHDPKPKDGNRS